MDIHALQQIVHRTRDARRKQTLLKFSPAVCDQLIQKYHPDYRERAYRPIRFGPNSGDKTVVELAALLEGDSSIADEFDLTADYTTDVLWWAAGGPVVRRPSMRMRRVPRSFWRRSFVSATPTA